MQWHHESHRSGGQPVSSWHAGIQVDFFMATITTTHVAIVVKRLQSVLPFMQPDKTSVGDTANGTRAANTYGGISEYMGNRNENRSRSNSAAWTISAKEEGFAPNLTH